MNHLILFASIGGDLAQTAEDIAQNVRRGLAAFHRPGHQLLHRRAVSGQFAYKPILKVLAERRQHIADGLANAEKIKQELARTEAMQREVLDKANVQATKLIEEARAAAARVREQETQKAIAQAEQIIAKAREATALEHGRMLADLKREVGSLVVAHHQPRSPARSSPPKISNGWPRKPARQLAA